LAVTNNPEPIGSKRCDSMFEQPCWSSLWQMKWNFDSSKSFITGLLLWNLPSHEISWQNFSDCQYRCLSLINLCWSIQVYRK
jgi:hypothetical protein